MKKNGFKAGLFICLATVLIPVLLVFQTVQSYRYKKLRAEIKQLEEKQVELVEQNRKLISDISVLSSSERIEKIAEGDLGMHKAGTEDIVRVEIKGDNGKKPSDRRRN
ncbi:MAG: cell division protein FtsL [Spirochaetia bacterium]|uniref:cell division protein FtsL n=1 Tax=Treponema berlinense TaxID=225004 RepID=UPI0015BBE7EB|nr:cell division protein FtsL [Treponema berlinense]MDD5789908.1 cell division protein FtsL [Spirochaetia bacterium]